MVDHTNQSGILPCSVERFTCSRLWFDKDQINEFTKSIVTCSLPLCVHHSDLKANLDFPSGRFSFSPSSELHPPLRPISWSYQQCVCLPSERQPKLIGPHQLQTFSETEEGVCVCVCVQCLHSTCQLVLRFFSLRGRYIKVGKHMTATAALGKHSIV